MVTCLGWILGYMRLEIWRKIGLSADGCSATRVVARCMLLLDWRHQLWGTGTCAALLDLKRFSFRPHRMRSINAPISCLGVPHGLSVSCVGEPYQNG